MHHKHNIPKLIRFAPESVFRSGLIKGQHKYMTQQGFEVVGVSSSGEALDEVRRNEGIRTEVVEMTRKLTPLKDLKSLWQFYRLCRREKPTIVHSHTPKAGIVGMMGAWLARVPIRLHTVAGMPLMEAKGKKRALLDWVEKLTYAFATRVYPNSQGLYDFIVANGYARPKKLHVIANGSSNGIDTSYFSQGALSEEYIQDLKEALKIEPNDFVFIFVGRMVGDKGVHELVEAFDAFAKPYLRTAPAGVYSAVQQERRPILMLVGNFEEDLDPLARETVKMIHNHPYIYYVGYRKNVRDYFAVADALVFPSYREGFPNVVMQAGAMGLPSIVSDINGCNEIIVEGENGTIIPVKNKDAIVEAMDKLYNDGEYYEGLKRNARRMIEERYEQKVVWEALLEEYKRLLADIRFADPR